MNILIDTHVLLWWCHDVPRLSPESRALLETTEQRGNAVGLSIISLWEISKLVSKKKYEISRSLDDWFEELEHHPSLKVLPLSVQIILDSMRLGSEFPKDPADQLIAATARCHGLRLMTADERIRRSGVVALA